MLESLLCLSGTFGWLRAACFAQFQINVRGWLIQFRLILDVRLFWLVGKGFDRFQVNARSWLIRIGLMRGVRLFSLLGKGRGRYDANEREERSASASVRWSIEGWKDGSIKRRMNRAGKLKDLEQNRSL